MSPLIFFAWCIASYFLGSISWSYFITWRIRKMDLRTFGSGNLGATNAGRLLGKKWAVIIYILDFGKGAVGTLVPHLLAEDPTWAGMPLPIAAGFMTVMGHIFPFYLKFRGGKGVATGSGVVIALAPWTGLGAVLTWIAVAATTRLVSAASVLGALSMPLWYLLTPGTEDFWAYEGFLIAVALLVTVMHHSNIRRILRGEENKSWVKKS